MTDKLTEALRAKCEEAAKEFCYKIYSWRGRSPEFMVAQVGKLRDEIEHQIAPLVQSLRDEVIEECLAFVEKEIQSKTQQKDEDFPDAAGGPRVYVKKGEWLASKWEWDILDGLRKYIRALKGAR